MSTNRCVAAGNLGKNPELKYTPGGKSICQFNVAVNNRYKNKAGEWVDGDTEWFRVVVWGPLGEAAAEKLRKGSPCQVEGRMQTREWVDKDGAKRYATELIADRVLIPIEPPKPGAREERPPERRDDRPERPRQEAPYSDLDELPF